VATGRTTSPENTTTKEAHDVLRVAEGRGALMALRRLKSPSILKRFDADMDYNSFIIYANKII
jgi:hypothetical protein